jgi:hypothetical protein
MAREGKFRPAPRPTTLHEICRRYVATATTLAQVLGVPLTEAFMQEHHQAIACCFIESGRVGVRLPASVTLPPLASAVNTRLSRDASALEPQGPEGFHSPDERNPKGGRQPKPDSQKLVAAEAAGPEVSHTNGHAIPTCLPADGDLPCRGQEIARLTPAQLAMLLSKVARLVHQQGDGWVPLLHALQAERARRRPARFP